MVESAERRTERLFVALTATEKRALEILARAHPDKYDGASTVVRDYSLSEAVRTVEVILEAAHVESVPSSAA